MKIFFHTLCCERRYASINRCKLNIKGCSEENKNDQPGVLAGEMWLLPDKQKRRNLWVAAFFCS